MPFDLVSPIHFGAELLPVGSPLDVVSTHRSQQEVVVLLPQPHGVRLVANAIGRLSEESVLTTAVSPKVQRAVLFTRRNELVQDRDAGSVWPALADSFLLVEQPCRR